MKIFLSCTCDPDNVPENLREIYDYIREGKISGELTRRIDAAVQKALRNEEWRSEYMKELLHDDDVRRDAFAEGIAEGKAAGKAEGRSEERVDAVQRLLIKGAEMDFIQSLDYSEEEIREAKSAMLTTR